MTVVALQILEPANGARIVGGAPARLHGQIAEPLAQLRWYSSLHAPPGAGSAAAVAINQPGDDPLDFQAALEVGSHVLTFAAQDLVGDTPDVLARVQRAGMAGGPLPPYLVHVFRARIVAPAAGAVLSKADSTLDAWAPVAWGKPAYAAVNRLRYRWRFAPSGAPAGRGSGELAPDPAQLTADTGGGIPVARYRGALPGTIATGAYTVTLRVEDTGDPTTGEDTAIAVTVTP